MGLKARPSRRIRWIALAGAVVPVALTLAQEPPRTFRAGIDLIAVDVDVVDHDGGPVAGLRPDQFQVSIDGKSRKVISADFVSVTTRVSSSEPRTWAESTTLARPAPTSTGQPGRVYILAFDALSFSALEIAPAREAAHVFVDRLQPNDLVGLIVFPEGPLLQVTTDRGPLLQELDRVVGQASPAAINRWQLTPSEIADLTSPPRSSQDLLARVHEICAGTNDPATCQSGSPPYVVLDATVLAQFEEMEIAQRLGALQGMFKSLAGSPERKVVVLISAGVMASDRQGGRPDVGEIGQVVGRAAAEANASVYALHFDRLRADVMSASRAGARRPDFMRDTAILSHALDQIAGASGGSFFTVTQGGGGFAFNRILNETSGYYLLGVEPADKDRDGRSHQLQVRVAQKAVTVRGRSWVTLPKVGAAVPTAPGPSSAPASTGSRAMAPASPPKPLPESVRPLADAYGRGDYAGAAQLLSHVTDLANLIHDVRTADPLWPNTPRRERVFALELALAGLSSRNGFARDEGVKLLTHAHLKVEQAGGADAFACAWYWAEAAGLEGLWLPDVSLPFVERASRRCSLEPRLNLARAVILEQQSGEKPDPIQAQEVLAAYQDVAKGSNAAHEAMVRAAYFIFRSGDVDRALELLPAAAGSSPDQYVRYTYGMVRGHVLRARGQLDDAAIAYRDALKESPGAQSARVSLMTLLLSRGDGAEAARLAEAVQTAAPDQTDPWWTYRRGDFRAYPAILARLRELGQ